MQRPQIQNDREEFCYIEVEIFTLCLLRSKHFVEI